MHYVIVNDSIEISMMVIRQRKLSLAHQLTKEPLIPPKQRKLIVLNNKAVGQEEIEPDMLVATTKKSKAAEKSALQELHRIYLARKNVLLANTIAAKKENEAVQNMSNNNSITNV